jgi:DNA-binding MarR family transcriptional regulator
MIRFNVLMTKRELSEQLRREVRSAQVAVATRDQAVRERLGINATDHRCLDLLDQRGPMTAGALAEALHVTRSAVTTVIDRLEAMRYVRRAPGRRDRRQVLVELTPFLFRRARELYGDGSEAAAALERYSTGELELLCDFVRRDRELNERSVARLARAPTPSRRRGAAQRRPRRAAPVP